MGNVESSSVTQPPKTLGFVLDASTAFLTKRNIESPELCAEYLAARLLKCKRLDLAAQRDSVLPEKYCVAMRRGVQRLGTGEPIQYVIGEWDFRTLTLKTDSRALIPRPETEDLVQLVLDNPAIRNFEAPRMLDFGTGTGCIALSLATERTTAKLLAVDISADALSLATENAQMLGLADRVNFLNVSELDLLDFLEPGTLDVIVSNPPYIPSAQCQKLDANVREFEPNLALDGGPDGMDITRQLIEDAAMLLASGGWLYLEISSEDNQAPVLARYMEEVGFDGVKIHKDHRGANRFVSGCLADGL